MHSKKFMKHSKKLFYVQLAQGGCVWLDNSCSVNDLQTLRASLAAKLAFRSERIAEVVNDISQMIVDPGLLRSACLPMSSTEVWVCPAPAERDVLPMPDAAHICLRLVRCKLLPQ